MDNEGVLSYCLDEAASSNLYWSVGVLLSGIVLARFGLWVSDLTISQILQERVAVTHRGRINGVQGGLNAAMDTIKFALVVGLPGQTTFGWLVIASFAAITLGNFIVLVAFA